MPTLMYIDAASMSLAVQFLVVVAIVVLVGRSSSVALGVEVNLAGAGSSSPAVPSACL